MFGKKQERITELEDLNQKLLLKGESVSKKLAAYAKVADYQQNRLNALVAEKETLQFQLDTVLALLKQVRVNVTLPVRSHKKKTEVPQ